MRLVGVAWCVLMLTGAGTAADRLPDGGIATAGGTGPVEAWYGQPTTRYDHGILGDAIEAGALVVTDAAGRRHEAVLPRRLVFEDITPRLVDLDGDGSSEIVTIRTDVAAGASVAIYALSDGQLTERAVTAPIGLPHRWLSIAAIADFTADPGLEIAVVKTPHIGGVLEILSLQGRSLRTVRAPQSGYSTHVIGSRELSLATAQHVSGDNFAKLALPTQDRMTLVVLEFEPGLRVVRTIALERPLQHPLDGLTEF